MSKKSQERFTAPVVPLALATIGSLVVPHHVAAAKPSTAVRQPAVEAEGFNELEEIKLIHEQIMVGRRHAEARASRSQERKPIMTAAIFRRELDKVLFRLATCESGNKADTNTGNGFYGEYQFDGETWTANGGGQYASRADLASNDEQTVIAEKLEEDRGWQPWPACSAKLHLGERFILNGYVRPPAS